MSGARAEQVGGRQLGWLAEWRRDSNFVWGSGAAAASSCSVAGRRRAASLEAAVVSSGPATILITFITINVHSHCFFITTRYHVPAFHELLS